MDFEQLSKAIDELEIRLAQPGTYEMEASEIITLQKKLSTTRKALAEAEAKWLDAQAKLELAREQD